MMSLELKYSESQEIQGRLEIIEQQIMELRLFHDGVEEIGKSNENSILAPLGKGVFIPAEIKERFLYVGVGSGIFLKRSPLDTKNSVNGQIMKLSKLKEELSNRLMELQKEMEKIVASLDKG